MAFSSFGYLGYLGYLSLSIAVLVVSVTCPVTSRVTGNINRDGPFLIG